MRHITRSLQSMTRLEQATLLIGTCATVLAITGIATGIDSLNYTAMLLGRVSGLAYVTVVDKFRKMYMLPIAVIAANSVINEPYLLFVEMAVQSVMYQVSAYALFSKLAQKRVEQRYR